MTSKEAAAEIQERLEEETDPVERLRLLDRQAEFEGRSLTGDGGHRRDEADAAP